METEYQFWIEGTFDVQLKLNELRDSGQLSELLGCDVLSFSIGKHEFVLNDSLEEEQSDPIIGLLQGSEAFPLQEVQAPENRDWLWMEFGQKYFKATLLKFEAVRNDLIGSMRLSPEEGQASLSFRWDLPSLIERFKRRKIELLQQLVFWEHDLQMTQQELRIFEAKYNEQLLSKSKDLDTILEQIAALKLSFQPDNSQLKHEYDTAKRHAEQTRQEASQQTHTKWEEEGMAKGGKVDRNSSEFKKLRKLYIELARLAHSNFTTDKAEQVQRDRVMQRINACYEAGDLRGLQAIQASLNTTEVSQVYLSPLELIRQLRDEIYALNQKIQLILEQLKALKNSVVYQAFEKFEWFNRMNRSYFDEIMEEKESEIIKERKTLNKWQTMDEIRNRLAERLLKTMDMNEVLSELQTYFEVLSQGDLQIIATYLSNVVKS